MLPLMLFRAESTPRYSGDEQAALAGNLVSQRAFLTAMITDHCIHYGATLEIRFAASASGAISSFIALHGGHIDAGEPEAASTKLVARLLPADYSWRLSNDIGPYNAGIRAPVHVARVIRTAQVLDLPYVPPDPRGTTVKTFDSLGLVPGAPIGRLQGGRMERSFPDIEEGPQQFDEKRLCLPFLGSLNGWRTEMRVLFEQMLANRPSVISIGMRPLQETELGESRLLAAGWRRMLGPALGSLANSGFADAASLSRTFDRFAMPAAYLVQASVKCAALSAESAAGVASVLAACLGGSTGFEIRHPTRPANVRDLPTMDGDYPVPGQSQRDTDDLREDQRERLLAEGIALQKDDPALEFMARVNHVYTLDEIYSVVELPVADDHGLPGMITRPVPPFPTPWAQGDDAATPMRIGMIQPRYPDPLAGHGGRKPEERFHRLSLEALTKHALIVGSTGSGKTLTTLFLARELKRNKVPFMVIEPVKTEYYQKLSAFMGSELRRWRFEGDALGEPVADFLVFDPMTLQVGVSVARHVSYLKSCFLAAFPLPPVEALLLEAGLRDYYTSTPAQLGCGLKLFARGTATTSAWRDDPQRDAAGAVLTDGGVPRTARVLHPSLDGFFRFFKQIYLPRTVMGTLTAGGPNPGIERLDRLFSAAPEAKRKVWEEARRQLPLQRSGSPKQEELLTTWRQMFERRFDAIQSGPIGLAAQGAAREFERTGVVVGFERMLEGYAVIELDGIPDDEQKSLMMAFLLTALYERRQADDLIAREMPEASRPKPQRDARHVMIVEEAHRVLSSSSGSSRSGEVAGMDANTKSVSLFVDMLAEIRAFGQGIVIVEQIPTKIVGEAIKNTNLKIMLRLTSRDDRDYLGEAMNFTESQKRFVATLRAERGKDIGMVVFEEGIEQPMMLSLPFKPTGDHWVFDEQFKET